jgi:hypothetical protein
MSKSRKSRCPSFAEDRRPLGGRRAQSVVHNAGARSRRDHLERSIAIAADGDALDHVNAPAALPGARR